MKSRLLLRLAPTFTALLTFSGLAQAHPGHVLPHGSSSDGMAMLIVVAIVATSWGACQIAARRP